MAVGKVEALERILAQLGLKEAEVHWSERVDEATVRIGYVADGHAMTVTLEFQATGKPQVLGYDNGWPV